jgi:hypothetical protein
MVTSHLATVTMTRHGHCEFRPFRLTVPFDRAFKCTSKRDSLSHDSPKIFLQERRRSRGEKEEEAIVG